MMSSQDEKLIWEDLHHFPDQILSWERKQKMLENIRKERRLMQKSIKRRKYFGWAASGFITVVALFAFIWIKPFSSPVETTGSKELADQPYYTAAQKELKAIHLNKEFHLEQIEKENDYIVVGTKNQEAFVTFERNPTDVSMVAVTCTIDELSNTYQKYVETARDAFKKANQQVAFQKIVFNKGKERTTMSFWLEDSQKVTVDLKTNKVSDFNIYYQIGDVDKKYVSIAQRTLMLATDSISNSERFTFTKAEKSSDRKEEMWTLKNEQELYSVKIGANTGQVYSVNNGMNDSIHKIKSADEAVSVAKPLIKKVFGIDITGYKAYGKRSWGGYVLKSQGKPNISISTGDFKIGNIIAISID